MTRCLRVIRLTKELVRYAPSLQLQEKLVANRKAGTIDDTLLIVQHYPVVSVGKRGTSKDLLTGIKELLRLGIDHVTVPRGGETTYHGPGQLVAYPIVDLRQLGLGARAFVEGLEDAMVQAVGCFGIQARGRVPGKTGVWVGERKIGAVGVRITHGISSHGIALNVTTDLAAYKHIVPCGTPDKEVTSVLQELRWPCSGLKKVHGSVDCSTVWPAAGMDATCTGVKQGVAAQGGALPEQQQQQQQQLEKEGQYKQQMLLLRAAEECLVAAIAGSLALDPVEAQLS